jgi:hypothetical protein
MFVTCRLFTARNLRVTEHPKWRLPVSIVEAIIIIIIIGSPSSSSANRAEAILASQEGLCLMVLRDPDYLLFVGAGMKMIADKWGKHCADITKRFIKLS